MSDFFSGTSKRGARVDVNSVLGVSFLECLQEVVDAGGMVSVGVTRDGGALSVALWYERKSNKDYFRNELDACDYLTDGAKAIRELAKGGRGDRSGAAPQEAPRAPLRAVQPPTGGGRAPGKGVATKS